MQETIKKFAADDSGAITVDWVVLTAAIAGMGLAVLLVVTVGVEDMSTDIATHLDTAEANSDPFSTN